MNKFALVAIAAFAAVLVAEVASANHHHRRRHELDGDIEDHHRFGGHIDDDEEFGLGQHHGGHRFGGIRHNSLKHRQSHGLGHGIGHGHGSGIRHGGFAGKGLGHGGKLRRNHLGRRHGGIGGAGGAGAIGGFRASGAEGHARQDDEFGGLADSKTHLGDEQFAEGQQGSFVGGNKRFDAGVNSHDLNENEGIHGKKAFNKDQTIIKNKESGFENVDGFRNRNDQSDGAHISAEESGFAGQGSSGKLGSKHELDRSDLVAGGAKHSSDIGGSTGSVGAGGAVGGAVGGAGAL